jgi:hypothetical protein
VNFIDQLIRCYQHQHPEDYARGAVEEPWLPELVRYGVDEVIQTSTTVLHEEAMGLDSASTREP